MHCTHGAVGGLDLLTAAGERRTLSREREPELFRAVIFFGELPTSTVPAERKLALVREARKDYVRTYSHIGSAEAAPDEEELGPIPLHLKVMGVALVVPLVADGRPSGYYAIYHDVSELQRQKQHYESLFELSPTAVVTINLEGAGGGSALTLAVADPKLSTIRQAISDLLGQAIDAGTQYAARAQFDKSQVYSESQLNLTVGADLKYGAGTLNTTFDWSSTTRKNKIIAKYQQIYYTIDMDTPATPAAVFASSNTLAGIKAAIPPGSCPVYVAGVTYGMMALTFIETDFSQTDMSIALDAAYGGGNLDVEIRSGVTKRQVLESSNTKTVVYGGASDGVGQIETGYKGFF